MLLDRAYLGAMGWPTSFWAAAAGQPRGVRDGRVQCTITCMAPPIHLTEPGVLYHLGYAVDKLVARTTSPAYWERVVSFLAQEGAGAATHGGRGGAAAAASAAGGASEEVASETIMFVKAVVRHVGPAAVAALRAPLERVAAASTERASQRAAAEIVAGVLRGLKNRCVPPRVAPCSCPVADAHAYHTQQDGGGAVRGGWVDAAMAAGGAAQRHARHPGGLGQRTGVCDGSSGGPPAAVCLRLRGGWGLCPLRRNMTHVACSG